MLTFYILFFALLFFSVMVHEVAHGLVAEGLGDPTARLAGRITLNPLRHIDPFGTIFLPVVLILTSSPIVIGWAKPVPYNPANLFRDYKYGPLKVALAGPFANVVLALVFGLGARFTADQLSSYLVAIFGLIALMNIFLALFNLIPIPPLDGSKLLSIFFPGRSIFFIEQLGVVGIFFVMLLIFFAADILFNAAASIVQLIEGNAAFSILSQIFFAPR